jgi:hypothetical protein
MTRTTQKVTRKIIQRIYKKNVTNWGEESLKIVKKIYLDCYEFFFYILVQDREQDLIRIASNSPWS